MSYGTQRRGWGCPGHSVSPMDEVDRRVGGGARHLDRGTSRLQGPRRGGPPGSPTSVSQSADTFHVREEAGGSGAVWPLMPGWGGDKLHREMCPSK